MSLGVSPGFFLAAVCSDCGWPPFLSKKRADSLMDDISLFVEENTEAEIIDEEREIR